MENIFMLQANALSCPKSWIKVIFFSQKKLGLPTVHQQLCSHSQDKWKGCSTTHIKMFWYCMWNLNPFKSEEVFCWFKEGKGSRLIECAFWRSTSRNRCLFNLGNGVKIAELRRHSLGKKKNKTNPPLLSWRWSSVGWGQKDVI